MILHDRFNNVKKPRLRWLFLLWTSFPPSSLRTENIDFYVVYNLYRLTINYENINKLQTWRPWDEEVSGSIRGRINLRNDYSKLVHEWVFWDSVPAWIPLLLIGQYPLVSDLVIGVVIWYIIIISSRE